MIKTSQTYLSAKTIKHGLSYGMSPRYMQNRYLLEMFWFRPNGRVYEYRVVHFAVKPTKRQVRKAVKQFREAL